MNCQNCGEPVAEGATTCSNCGTPIPETQQPIDGDGSDTDTESGISRRGTLAAAGAVLAVGGGAGLFVFGSDSSSSGPTAVVARSWEAWEAGDADTYADLYHSESPRRTTDWWTNTIISEDADFGPDEGVDWTIKRRETIEQTDDRATVEEEYTWYDPLPSQPDQEIQQRYTYHIDLRKEDDEWKIWDEKLVDQIE